MLLNLTYLLIAVRQHVLHITQTILNVPFHKGTFLQLDDDRDSHNACRRRSQTCPQHYA